MDKIFVIGHVNPDTDTIAAAMGYAWLLRERDAGDFVAARAGAVNPQTAWTLKRLGLDAPVLLNDASPRFEAVTRRLDTAPPDAPLREAWAIAARTWGLAPVVDADGKPCGLVTGASLFAFMNEMVGPHPKRQEMKLAEILEAPCRDACQTGIPQFPANARIRDSLNRILREEGDNFFVVDETGHYAGVCRQRDLLNPPRLKLILVDHNEPRQAIASLEEAELLEILDHHRLGNPSTHVPIRFTVDIVGSTSTLVSEQIEEAGLSAPAQVAGMLLAGLLSDTLVLTSPTTTERDRKAAERLGRWAFVRAGPLAGETIQAYGQQVLNASAGLTARAPEEIVGTDLKLYEAGGYRFAIAQAEVTDLVQLAEAREKLQAALSALRDKRALDFAMLMVTDVVRGSSRLLLTDELPELSDLPYPPHPDGTRLAEGVVSRKKQLLPVVLGLLER
ncbi:MAG: Inorganic pyrophosphatase/exopolyphosphatase [Anaerolineaceae bacterium]|nr:MAG: Inorganic pyrophosphatase/exopolyphosphatase [Anaerolineaceae bacterium]